MPRNGSGTYSLPAGNPVATQTLITSNWANTTMTDLGNAITQSLARDGQTLPTANLPMGGFRHTGVGDPVDRDNYNTLGFLQDGKATRLTNVAGVNQITADLPGSPTALVNGMTLQLVPVNDNTDAVTINIDNIGFKTVKTVSGSDLAAGNLKAGSPYTMLYDGLGFVVIAGPLGTFAQSAMSGWERPASGTYPPLTVVNGTTIGIPAGVGRIIAPGTKDASGVKEVKWSAQNLVITGLASAWSSQIGVDANGAIQQFPGGFLPTYARDYIMLGTAVHINGAVTSTVTRPAIYGDMTYATYDIAALLQNTITSGGRLFANGINPFHINIEAGNLFAIGSDPDEPNSPNIFEFPDQLNISFNPITATNGVGALTQDAPITFYDPNGTGVVTAIPGPSATAVIHRLYFLSGQFLFQYGQKTYATLQDALNSILVDNSTFVTATKLGNATLLGYVVSQKDSANLNDTTKSRLVSKGGADFQIGSSGSISDAPSDGLTYGRKNATWTEVVPMPRGAATTNRFITYYTATAARFTTGVNDTPEGGASSGSNFDIRSYTDTGTLIGTAIRIIRATMETLFFANMTIEKSSQPLLYVNNTGNAANSRKASFSIDASGTALLQTNNDDNSVKSQVRMSGAGLFDLTLAGTSFFSVIPGRLQADFTTATLVNRMSIQTSVLNGVTSPLILPNGTGNLAAVTVLNSSDPNNTGLFSLQMTATLAKLNSGMIGAGVTRPVSIQFNDVEKVAIAVDGTITSAASLVANSNFLSSNTSWVGAPSAAGTLFLRPNGSGSATGQVTLDSAGLLTVNGDVSVAKGATTGGVFVSANAGVAADYRLLTGANIRWAMRKSTAAESGSNAGSNWQLARYNDAGTLIDVPVETFRNDGHTEFGSYIVTKGSTSGMIYNGRTSGAGEWVQFSDLGILRWNSSGDKMTLNGSGVCTATNFSATSDRRLKHIDAMVDPHDFSTIQLYNFTWIATGCHARGPMAQDIRDVAPEYVHADGQSGILSIDKASLALEWAASLERKVAKLLGRIEELEALLGTR